MRSTTDHVREGRNPTVPPLTEARGPESPLDAPPDMEDSCEAVER
jgi:hypothetical protein